MNIIIKTDCQCPKCVRACQHLPGKFNPDEADRAIDAGYADRMMLDWLEPSYQVGNDERIPILAPAALGHEGRIAPTLDEMYPDGFLSFPTEAVDLPCALFKNGKCTIHDSDFKPQQCRTTFVCTGAGDNNYDIARLWDTDRGRQVVQKWREITGCREELS